MRIMVIVKATPSSESEAGPGAADEKLMTDMGNFNEELVKAGIMLAGEGLRPSAKGKRVRFSGDSRTVIDGPFAETKELIAGFWLWQVRSMDEALEWVKRMPQPHREDSEVELRPLYEMDDFGDAMTPAAREQEDRMRAELASKT